jgi:hypothetical protein
MDRSLNFSIIKKLPLDHFCNVTSEVIELLLNGQCCGIYGIPGYGMDYFAKQVEFLLALNHPSVHTIFLNLELENNKIKILENELEKILDTKNINEIKLKKFLENSKITIILSEVYHPKHIKLFKYLNAIREINQKNFTVLTVANYTLFKNTKKYLQHGKNLFIPLKKIPNFDYRGIKRIIKLNNEEYNWNTPLESARKILFLSGGNPALVYSICIAMYYEDKKIIERPDKLVKYQPLNFRIAEIADLLTKLSVDEQIEIGILNNNGTLFSELLVEFLKNNEIEGLDKLFPDLTKTDRKILTLFIRNPGVIIDKDQLSLILDQTADTYSEWAIYKAVARVRNKIKDRYTIKTLKGRGWRMESK